MQINVSIRKNAPIPEDTRFSWKPILKRMKVGDSFVLPEGASNARQSIYAYGRSHQMKFLVKDGQCWRVK